MAGGIPVVSEFRPVTELGGVGRSVVRELGDIAAVVRVGNRYTHAAHLWTRVLRMVPVWSEGRDGGLNGGSLVSFFNRAKDVSDGKRCSLFWTEGHNSLSVRRGVPPTSVRFSSYSTDTLLR
mgnify:CR=1 FL=1